VVAWVKVNEGKYSKKVYKVNKVGSAKTLLALFSAVKIPKRLRTHKFLRLICESVAIN
jgi:hypothetical protein